MASKPSAAGLVGHIDPFRERQVPDVAGRFVRERDRHQRQADLMWLGALTLFSDHELRLLDDLGYLSQHDLGALAQAGRALRPRPAAPGPVVTPITLGA